jgi:apolipoprotein N-acyltransferase
MQLGESLTGWPRLIGAAELVGARGLSFWMALVAGLLAAAVDQGQGRLRLRWRPLAAAVLVAAAPMLYSLERWDALETRPVARVTVLQPDLSPEVKTEPGLAVERTVRWTEGLLGSADSGPESSGAGRAGRPSGGPVRELPDPALRSTGLLIFPETAFPVVPGGATAPSGGAQIPLEDWIRRVAGRVDAPVLYGALGSAGGAGGGRLNAAFYRTPPAAGAGEGRYGKRRLVPGFERVPFVDATRLRRWLPGAAGSRGSGFRPGTTAPLFRAGNGSFGVLICYESIFGDLARGYRRRGADFLVNITNDGWFGTEEPAWRRTAALWQHPAHLVMRAVENRVGVVRAANNGISGIIDPRGRWTRRSGLFRPEALAGEVRTGTASTPFARFGDLAGPLAALAAAGVTLAATARRRVRSGRAPDGGRDGEAGPASTTGIEPREEP